MIPGAAADSPKPAPKGAARCLFPGEWLVCFAVKEEAAGFSPPDPSIRALITGMGRANAERAIAAAVSAHRPSLVLTCGFAGGLGPALKRGMVVFSIDSDPALEPFLVAAGAGPANVYCVERVAVSVLEKQQLRQKTGADAVEMESQHIRAFCRAKNIPSATLRVILDTADEDLPLDFNQLMTANQQMDFKKLALVLLKHPGKIKGLLRLQKQSREVARKLGEILTALVSP